MLKQLGRKNSKLNDPPGRAAHLASSSERLHPRVGRIVELALLCALSVHAQPARITSPAPGSTLPGTTVTFSWSAGVGANAYWLDVGNVQGQGDIWPAGQPGTFPASVLSKTVNNIPCDGRTIYSQMWTRTSAGWGSPQRYSYKACTTAPTDPLPGTPFSILSVKRISSTTLSIGSECSETNPCNIRMYGTVFSYMRPLFDINVTGGTGVVFVYAQKDGLVVVGTSTLTLTCYNPSSRVCDPPGVIRLGITSFPPDTLALYTWDAGPIVPPGIPDGTPQPTVWVDKGKDFRAYLGRD